MANKQRGEVVITIDGTKYPMRLTLGALAELEDALDVTTPGELDRIITTPTYRQLVTMTHTLINFRQDEEKITRDQIMGADMGWQEAYFGIAAVVKASNPDGEGKDEKKGEGT